MKRTLTIGGLVCTLLMAGAISAEWRLDIASKQVNAGCQNVTVDFILYNEASLAGVVIPVVVRELDPGSFWTGALPYDTLGTGYSHPYQFNVSWNWNPQSPIWTSLTESLRPGIPLSPCSPDGDVGYDGVSPDHFAIVAAGAGGAELPNDGRPVVTITFDVTGTPGRFEFDTACFGGDLSIIYLTDAEFPPFCNHASQDPWTGCGHEFAFNKGVITIMDCDCTTLGDCNGDAAINPVDVMYLVNTVYRLRPAPPPVPWCPAVNGDWNCDDAITPLDVAEITAFVYRNSDIPPCNPCTGGRRSDLALATEDILFSKSEIEVGEPVWIGLHVHNLGLIAATNVAVAVYAGDPDSGGQLLGSAMVSDIPANQSRTQYIGTFTFDAPGSVDIFGTVDGVNEIDEVEEENNQALRPLIVE
jgi:hypothetical protein